MKNAHALAVSIDRYRERFPLERDTATRFLSFLSSSEKPFDNSNFEPGHCTGSAWIVDESCGSVLLTQHRKLEKWLQLGGHAEGETDLLNVAQREALEESGLSCVEPALEDIFDIDIHAIPARRDAPAHLHFDVRYLFRADSRAQLICSDESHALRWIASAEVSTLSQEESILRMNRKWQTCIEKQD